MSYKLLLILNAFVTVVFGTGFLVVPKTVLGLFRTETYGSTVLLSQFFGTALLALGLTLWFARNVSDTAIQKGVGIALLIGSLAGLIVTVIGMSSASGVIRANGWLAVVIYVLFALGYGFLLFLKPRMKEE